MGRTELPWLLWGRRIRPFSFGLSLACAVMTAIIATGGGVWGTSDWWTTALLTLSGAATLALWAGFWVPSTALMQHGLMLAAIVFAVRGTYIAMVGAPAGGSSAWLTAALSFTFTVMAGGAWLLERTTGEGRSGAW